MQEPEKQGDFFEGPKGQPRIEIPSHDESAAAEGSSGTEPNAFGNPDAPSGASSDSSSNSSSASNEGASAARRFDERQGKQASSGSPLQPEIPPFMRLLLGKYLEISLKLLTTPKKFFDELDTNPAGFNEAGCFLAISATANALLSVLFNKFNLFLLPKVFLADIAGCAVVTAVVCMMAQGMGSKANFATCFRMYSYLTCLSVLSSVPGLNIIASVAGLFYTFIGMCQILNLSLYQNCMIMFLAVFLQVLLTLGRMFS